MDTKKDYLIGGWLLFVVVVAIAFLPPLGIVLSMGFLVLLVGAWLAGLIKLRGLIRFAMHRRINHP